MVALTIASPAIASTPEVDALIASACPVAIGVSGGKDSCAVAFATVEYLDAVGHTGPRVLIHSDLGATEWKQSGEKCRELASRLGLELIVVRRAKGDMMDRWEQRWADNVARYASLSCVQLILPWSTPDMRFCTSELKTAPICAELVNRFPRQRILSVTGIRRQESSARAKAPVSKEQPKLVRKRLSTSGLDWHPIIDWTLGDVFTILRDQRFALHEAYTIYGASRVSCAYCIMSAADDLRAAAGCKDNHALYRRMVSLEAATTFAFQGGKWLGDVAPDLLSGDLRADLVIAKRQAAEREAAESLIPKHLVYTAGWPECIPTAGEAALLAEVRRRVASAVGLSIDFTSPAAIVGRYEQLMALKLAKGKKGVAA